MFDVSIVKMMNALLLALLRVWAMLLHELLHVLARGVPNTVQRKKTMFLNAG